MSLSRPICATLLFAGLFAAVSAAMPRAHFAQKKDAKAEAHVTDAQRIEEKWRPTPEKVQRAEAVLLPLSREQRAQLNALRILANRKLDSADAAPHNRLPSVAALGTGFSAGLSPDLALRLLALLRGGYAAREELVAECVAYLRWPRNAKSSRISENLLDLLVCDAICTREEREFAPLQAKAFARAKDVCAQMAWTSAPLAAPDGRQLRDLGCEAICRRLAIARSWLDEAPRGWGEVIEGICRKLSSKGRVWPEAYVEGNNAANVRSLLWLGALLALARGETEIDVSKGALAGNYPSACRIAGRALNESLSLMDVVPDLDGAALLALFAPDLEPESLRPLQKKLRKRAMDYLAAVDFKSEGLNLAQDLGWMSESRWEPPHDMRDLYLEPDSLTDLPFIAQVSLTLLGCRGGLAPAENCAALGTPNQIDDWLNALAVLDAHNTPRLQDKINAAIDKAAAWLREQQKPDGTFSGQYSTRLGGHCLNLLALLDAGVARDDTGIQKGMQFLPSMKLGQPLNQLDAAVYGYAVALLLLQKYYEKEQLAAKVLEASEPGEYKKATSKVWRNVRSDHRELITKMVAALTKDDKGFGWSYHGPAAQDGSNVTDFSLPTWRDNSNSQYAVMGLKAASLLGAPFERAVLAGEARRLIRCYRPDASLPAIKVRLPDDNDKRTAANETTSIVPGGWDYVSPKSPDSGYPAVTSPAMTAAGVSSLVICRDELWLAGLLDAKLKGQIELHIHGGLFWLGKNFRYSYSRGARPIRVGAEGWGKFYDMYSIERAGVLSNVRKMADVEWYAEGARLLVETQTAGGSWPEILSFKPAGDSKGPSVVDHCLAILFLKRAVVPVTRKPVITQGD